MTDHSALIERLEAAMSRDGKPRGDHMIGAYAAFAVSALESGDEDQAELASVYDAASRCIANETAMFGALSSVAAEAAAALRDLTEWRDIATAPKDGTVVMLFCPQGDGSEGSNFRVTCGNWHEEPGGTTVHRDLEGRYIDQDDRDAWEGWLSWDGGFSEDTMMPTHWLPLPSAPDQAKALK